ncbi:MAG: Ig-like domain-containing protein, partial [Chloroflexota bacterium]
MDGDVIVNDAQASEQDSARRGGLLYAILAIIILILMTSLGFCTDTTNLAELSAPTINTPDDEIPSGLVIFSGEGEPGSDVEVMLNGRSADTVTVYRDGEWIYSTNLEAGEYDVTVTGPDADGEMNLSSESVTFNVVQSYLAPKLNLPDAAQDANGFVLNGTGTPGSTVEIFNSGISLGTAVVGDDGTWSFDADLSTYRNRFMIRGFDPDGNSIGASPSVELLVDSAAAPLAINTPDIGEFELSDSGLSLSSVTFTGSGEPDSVVDLFVQGEIIGSPMVDGDGNWSFPFTLEGPAGDYSVRGLMFNNEDRDVLLDTEL